MVLDLENPQGILGEHKKGDDSMGKEKWK